ncbi:unnamed protein product [Closterium sp. NIES-65]|nr:unnamed protein product [Closterium sp. NIES-65]
MCSCHTAAAGGSSAAAQGARGGAGVPPPRGLLSTPRPWAVAPGTLCAGGKGGGMMRVFRPLCSASPSRNAAFTLLLALCAKTPEALRELASLLLPLHFASVEHELPSWEYLPSCAPRPRVGYAGLKNAGATCYMNSVFQQLFMQPQVRRALLAFPETPESDRPLSVIYQVQAIFSYLLAGCPDYFVPEGFWDAFRDYDGQPVNLREHQDAFEFFNRLYDSLDESMKAQRHSPTLTSIFGGHFAQQIICRGCPHRSEREEPFAAVSVDVKGKRGLQESLEAFVQGDLLEADNAYFCGQCGKKESLEAFVQGDLLEADNAYFCGQCGKKVDALKRACIKTLPPTLIIHLKCFDFDYETMQRLKLKHVLCSLPLLFTPPSNTSVALLPSPLQVDALKRACIKTLPPTLIIHLKRFDFDYETMQRLKLKDRFTFPLSLNMRPFTREGLAQKEREQRRGRVGGAEGKEEGRDEGGELEQGREEGEGEDKGGESVKESREDRVEGAVEEKGAGGGEERSDGYYEYSLVGVVVHSGTAFAGHYYSYIKERSGDSPLHHSRPSQSVRSKQWWLCFDDKRVEAYDVRELEKDCFGGKYSAEVYDNLIKTSSPQEFDRPNSAFQQESRLLDQTYFRFLLQLARVNLDVFQMSVQFDPPPPYLVTVCFLPNMSCDHRGKMAALSDARAGGVKASPQRSEALRVERAAAERTGVGFNRCHDRGKMAALSDARAGGVKASPQRSEALRVERAAEETAEALLSLLLPFLFRVYLRAHASLRTEDPLWTDVLSRMLDANSTACRLFNACMAGNRRWLLLFLLKCPINAISVAVADLLVTSCHMVCRDSMHFLSPCTFPSSPAHPSHQAVADLLVTSCPMVCRDSMHFLSPCTFPSSPAHPSHQAVADLLVTSCHSATCFLNARTLVPAAALPTATPAAAVGGALEGSAGDAAGVSGTAGAAGGVAGAGAAGGDALNVDALIDSLVSLLRDASAPSCHVDNLCSILVEYARIGPTQRLSLIRRQLPATCVRALDYLARPSGHCSSKATFESTQKSLPPPPFPSYPLRLDYLDRVGIAASAAKLHLSPLQSPLAILICSCRPLLSPLDYLDRVGIAAAAKLHLSPLHSLLSILIRSCYPRPPPSRRPTPASTPASAGDITSNLDNQNTVSLLLYISFGNESESITAHLSRTTPLIDCSPQPHHPFDRLLREAMGSLQCAVVTSSDCSLQCAVVTSSDCSLQCAVVTSSDCSLQCAVVTSSDCSLQCAVVTSSDCSLQCAVVTSSDCSLQCAVVTSSDCSLQCAVVTSSDCSLQCAVVTSSDCSLQCAVVTSSDCSLQCAVVTSSDCSLQCAVVTSSDCSLQCAVVTSSDCSLQCAVVTSSDCSLQCAVVTSSDCSLQCAVVTSSDCSLQCAVVTSSDCSLQCAVVTSSDCSLQCAVVTSSDCSLQCAVVTSSDCSLQCAVVTSSDCSLQCAVVTSSDCSLQCAVTVLREAMSSLQRAAVTSSRRILSLLLHLLKLPDALQEARQESVVNGCQFFRPGVFDLLLAKQVSPLKRYALLKFLLATAAFSTMSRRHIAVRRADLSAVLQWLQEETANAPGHDLSNEELPSGTLRRTATVDSTIATGLSLISLPHEPNA